MPAGRSRAVQYELTVGRRSAELTICRARQIWESGLFTGWIDKGRGPLDPPNHDTKGPPGGWLWWGG